MFATQSPHCNSFKIISKMRLILTSVVVFLSFLGPVQSSVHYHRVKVQDHLHRGVTSVKSTPSLTFLGPHSLPFSPANALDLHKGFTGGNSTPFLPFLDPVLSHALHFNPPHAVDWKKEAGGNSTTCKRPATVEKFAASLYTAIILTQDPEVFTAIELPGKKAAKVFYPCLYNALNKEKHFDAEGLARNASLVIAKAETLTLVKFVERMAYKIGEFLLWIGLLNCSNAVLLAFEYFELVRSELELVDGLLFEHHMHGMCQGLVDFIYAHDLKLIDVQKELADIFC